MATYNKVVGLIINLRIIYDPRTAQVSIRTLNEKKNENTKNIYIIIARLELERVGIDFYLLTN